jgi:hypothetical protein
MPENSLRYSHNACELPGVVHFISRYRGLYIHSPVILAVSTCLEALSVSYPFFGINWPNLSDKGRPDALNGFREQPSQEGIPGTG